MVNFREVNENDILKDQFDFREETYLCYADKQDRENNFKFDFFRENILKNIPKQNRTYTQKQLDLLYDDFMRYLTYITEKYYRNGFVDGSQLVMGCFEEQVKARFNSRLYYLNKYFSTHLYNFFT